MQVGLVTGKEKIDLVEFPDPEVSPGKAVVDIAYCGICGTDLHAFASGEPYNPAICGHEWVGHVSALDNAVSTCKEGDRVAIGAAGCCGKCAACARGDAAHCETAFMGMIGVGPMAAPHGGFASKIAFDGSRLYPIGDRLTDEQGGLLEPVTVAVHAVRRTNIRLGDSIVVIGGGPIGLLVLQCARASGAGTCILIEPQQPRRRLASKLGADLVVDPTTENTAEVINKHIGNTGADVVFECAGIPQTIDGAVGFVRRGGIVSLVGVPAAPSQINGATWLAQEIQLSTSIAYFREEFFIAHDLVQDGRVNTDLLHTSTVGLGQLADAFAGLAREPTEVKVLVDPRR